MPIIPILKIDWTMSADDFNNVYDLEVGDVFQFTRDVDTILKRVIDDKPVELATFDVQLILPGTAMFTTYKHNSFVVIAKELA